MDDSREGVARFLSLIHIYPAPGIWRINVEPIQMSEGEYHMWLPMEEFLSGEVYFLEADVYKRQGEYDHPSDCP